MTSPRKHPSTPFWFIVVLVAVLTAYPLSMGPAAWIFGHEKLGVTVPRIYAPIGWIAKYSPGKHVYVATGRYLKWWLPKAVVIVVPAGRYSNVAYSGTTTRRVLEVGL